MTRREAEIELRRRGGIEAGGAVVFATWAVLPGGGDVTASEYGLSVGGAWNLAAGDVAKFALWLEAARVYFRWV